MSGSPGSLLRILALHPHSHFESVSICGWDPEICLFTHVSRGYCHTHQQWECSARRGGGWRAQGNRKGEPSVRSGWGTFQCSAWDMDAGSSLTCTTLTSPRYGGWGPPAYPSALSLGVTGRILKRRGFHKGYPGHQTAFWGRASLVLGEAVTTASS